MDNSIISKLDNKLFQVGMTKVLLLPCISTQTVAETSNFDKSQI